MPTAIKFEHDGTTLTLGAEISTMACLVDVHDPTQDRLSWNANGKLGSCSR